MSARFQHTMERISHIAGSWPHFGVWLLLLCGWVILGIPLHWSNTWQLIANTPTTWYELFLGLALLVDGALQIKMLLAITDHIEQMMGAILEEENKIAHDLEERPHG